MTERMPADTELSAILRRRNERNDALENGENVEPRFVKTSVYSEFTDFSRKEIKEFQVKFDLYNVSGTGSISLSELKVMMEKLGAPQTHLGLKNMMKEADVDGDGAISFREFLQVLRSARAGELDQNSALGQLATASEIAVEQVGVGTAKNFFEAKIAEINKGSRFENEIREEKEELKRAEEDKKKRQNAFKEKAKLFNAA